MNSTIINMERTIWFKLSSNTQYYIIEQTNENNQNIEYFSFLNQKNTEYNHHLI